MKTTRHKNKSYRFAQGGSVPKDFYSRGEVDESEQEYYRPKFDPEIGIRENAPLPGPLRKMMDYVPSPISAAITGKFLPSGREVDDAKRATVRREKKRSRTDRASGE